MICEWCCWKLSFALEEYITFLHVILNGNNIAHYIALHCGIIDQINAAFVGIKYLFQKHKETVIIPNFWMVAYIYFLFHA